MTYKTLLSLDVSSTCTGYTFFEKKTKSSKYKHTQTNSIKAKDKNIYQRFNTIHQHFLDNNLYTKPTLVVFENYAFGGNRVTQLAELNGLLKYFYTLNGIPIEVIAPTSIKKYVTGNGRCKKEDIRNTIKQSSEYKHITFKNLDESDSFAVGLGFILREESTK